MINIKENEKLSILNHSCAHLLAQAVKHLYPNAMFWVGPVIEEGFYYDIDLGDEVVKEEDLACFDTDIESIEDLQSWLNDIKVFSSYQRKEISKAREFLSRYGC